jgi:hypothetical protein
VSDGVAIQANEPRLRGLLWTVRPDDLAAVYIATALLLGPSFFYVALSASSFAAGMILTSILVLPILLRGVLRLRVSVKLVLGASFVAAWGTFPLVAYESAPVVKVVLSSLLVVWLFIITLLLNQELTHLRAGALRRALGWLAIFLLATGWAAAVFHFTPWGFAAGFARPVFPFREPSHYALIAGPVFAVVAAAAPRMRMVLVVNCFLLAVVFPSATLAAHAAVMSALLLRPKILLLGLVPFAALILAVVSVDTNYFAQRVGIGPPSANLSALFWLQGLDDAVNSFVESKGLGTGFQTIGSGPPGWITRQIQQVYAGTLTRDAGGFMAAKVTGEFGFVGLGLIMLLLRRMWCSGRELRRMLRARVSPLPHDLKLVAAHMVVVLYVVELLVRATGYFSPSVLLLGVALLQLHDRRYENGRAQAPSPVCGSAQERSL